MGNTIESEEGYLIIRSGLISFLRHSIRFGIPIGISGGGLEKGIRGFGGNVGVSDVCSIKLGSDIGQGSGVHLG